MSQGNETTGLASNIAAMMCYILMPVSSIVFLIVEKKDSDVRFHAWQSTFLGGGIIVLIIALQIFEAIMGSIAHILGTVVGFFVPIVWLGGLVLWVVCLVKAYQGERWKIPVVGDMAEKQMSI
ncbi:MAG: hypothetical protein COV45_08730 [Deltaproteobacteria bacterium CG11_big_fil_rev_8_21_14_0_20_47_16]|nr:MAG: hypothetical protein COV45_08730 [Deltaproteobacteria bacterium CG11_big_fil_rev_8_21_14_0_20_47_16]